MTKPTTLRSTQSGTYRNTAILATAALALIVLSACRKNDEKKYTWADRLPQSNCDTRTPEAKAKLGGCPKLADPQHPTPEEVSEFVDYMNKKQAIEGTVVMEGLEAPGCVKWKVDAYGQPAQYYTEQKQGCINVEEQLRKHHTP